MKKKVFIGITANSRKIKVNFFDNQSVSIISNDYFSLLNSYSHVVPIIIPGHVNNIEKDLISILDGLILSSGEDLDPSMYSQKSLIQYDENIKGLGIPFKRPYSLSPNPVRDQIERNLYFNAKKKKIPILGICRGMQLINVVEGGTLFQELPQNNIRHFLEDDGWINYHDIFCKEESKTYGILGKKQTTISSIHHQAVDKLGENLNIAATSEDGIVEIIESKDKNSFILGFQGHVEAILSNYPSYRKLIDAFILAAEKGC